VPTFLNRGLPCGQLGGTPTVINLSFIYRSLYFSFKSLLIYAHEAEWTPLQTHCYSEKLAAPGIELRTSVSSAARNSDHETTEECLTIMLMIRKFFSLHL
jgi:hypothetical protein